MLLFIPKPRSKTQKVKRRQKVDQLSDVDYVSTNTHSSQNDWDGRNFTRIQIEWLGRTTLKDIHKKWSNLTNFSFLFGNHLKNCQKLESVSLLINCVEMFVFGTNWTIWHLVVREQIIQISQKMDSRRRSTISEIHTRRISDGVARGKDSITDWIFQDSYFVGNFEDSKSKKCPSLLDVQETMFCFSQLHRVWICFSGCWTTYGWTTWYLQWTLWC